METIVEFGERFLKNGKLERGRLVTPYQETK